MAKWKEESHTPITHVQSFTVLPSCLDCVHQFVSLTLEYLLLRHERRLREADCHCASLPGMLRPFCEADAHTAVDWRYNADEKGCFLHCFATLRPSC